MIRGSWFTTNDGIIFARKETTYRQIFENRDYDLSGIRPDDRVVDIGANVGAFCIRAARLADRVTAVEPVTTDLLRANVRANRVPVTVIRAGLGTGGTAACSWDGCPAIVPVYTLSEIVRMAGGCDFLKCDCEGAEWLIRPQELDGIRRIEMELHIPPICDRTSPALLDYIGRHYDFGIDRMPCHDTLGVMGVLHAERKP